MHKHFSYKIETQGVALLGINNPPANTLSQAAQTELHRILDAIAADTGARAVVIHSEARKFFCAGADIGELDKMRTVDEGRQFSRSGQALLAKIEDAAKPFIAAVEGVAAGGGCELALACHMRVAGAGASFALPEINLGLMPGFGGSERILALAGQCRGLEIMLTGEQISSANALQMGLVNHVVAPGQALPAALSVARLIAMKSPDAVAAILEMARERGRLQPDARYKLESRLFGGLFATEGKRAGVSAFLARKKTPREPSP